MLDHETGHFVRLDLGFTPSPSGGGMFLLQEEEVHDGFLLMSGYAANLDSPLRKECTALVTIVGLCQSVFGYPNEEAFELDGRGEVGHGFYELVGSKWLDNLVGYNKRTYGSKGFHHELGGKFDSARHYFIGSKDGSAQFLAQGLRVETFTDVPYRTVKEEALRRLERWVHEYGAPSNGQKGNTECFPADLDPG